MRRGSINAPCHWDLGNWVNMQINNLQKPKSQSSQHIQTSAPVSIYHFAEISRSPSRKNEEKLRGEKNPHAWGETIWSGGKTGDFLTFALARASSIKKKKEEKKQIKVNQGDFLGVRGKKMA